MRGRFSRGAAWLGIAAFALCLAPGSVFSQTPSPLQEWQYSGGIILEKLFEPTLPKWHVVLGAGAQLAPLYEGAQDYRVQGGPVINVLYRDIAFFSLGEGVGMNIVRGDNYRAGISLGYDLGRRVSDDYTHLHGLGGIARAPFVKLFASYVISKEFPLVLRADVRQIVGSADGMLGDIEAYLPLPGSSEKLIMFAGPSITFANHRYMQRLFGVTGAQALASGYPEYDPHGGANAAGFGLSISRFITSHWLINGDASVNHLLGSARDSPITQKTLQGSLALSFAYSW